MYDNRNIIGLKNSYLIKKAWDIERGGKGEFLNLDFEKARVPADSV